MKLKSNLFFCMVVCISYVYGASESVSTKHHESSSTDSDDSFRTLYLDSLNDLEESGVDATSDAALKAIRTLIGRKSFEEKYVDNINDYSMVLISFINRMLWVPYNLSMNPDPKRATPEQKYRFFRPSLKLQRAHPPIAGGIITTDELIKPISRDYLIFCALRTLGKIGARFPEKEGRKIASFLFNFIIQNVCERIIMPTFIWAAVIEALNRIGLNGGIGKTVDNRSGVLSKRDNDSFEKVVDYYKDMKSQFNTVLKQLRISKRSYDDDLLSRLDYEKKPKARR